MKQLSVSWLDIEEAFENSFAEYHYYFDWETGQVLTVADETRQQLERIYEESYDPDTDQALTLTDVLPGLGLSEWEQQALLDAGHVENNGFRE